MIVDPDFFDHWRTGMVADAINDQMAAIYIMRLWAHCQERKSDSFVMPSRGLKAQCKFPGDADAFESALIEAGFLVRSGDTITALGWADKNASLISAWGNGVKGGRPKKNPSETQAKPMGNPPETQTEPTGNPSLTDSKPIRVDKSREEKKEEQKTTPAPSAWVSSSELVADGLPEGLATEWLAHRKARKAKLTALAWSGFKSEVEKAGWSVEDAVRKAIARNWTAFEAAWVAKAQSPPRQSYADQQRAQLAALTGARTHQGDVIDV